MALHQVSPSLVPELRRLLRRAHHVGEHDGGEHPIQVRLVVADGRHEALDLVEQVFLSAHDEEMLVPGERHEPRATDLIGEPPGLLHAVVEVAVAGHHQGGHVDGGKGRPSIDGAVHQRQGVHGSRARGVPHVVGEPGLHRVIVGLRRRERVRQELPGELLRAPQPFPALPVRDDLRILVLVRHGERVVRRVVPARAGAEQDQRDRALRVRRGEQHGHRAALRHAEHHRALGADGIHHGARVVHPDLERWESILGHPIGQSDAPFVEHHHTGERREVREEPREPRLRPHLLDVRDPAHHEQDVDWAVAEHLVRDVDAVGGLRVAGLGDVHA